METTGIKTNARFNTTAISSFLIFFDHNDKKLKSEVIDFDSARSLVSKLDEKRFFFGFSGNYSTGSNKDVLKMLDSQFRNSKGKQSLAKYEIYENKKGEKMTYLFLYKNDFSLKTPGEINFHNSVPLRAFISYPE